MNRSKHAAKWMRGVALALLASTLVVYACTINPQPFPPEANGRDGSSSGSALADAGASRDASAVPRDGGAFDDGDAADAARDGDADASRDGGDGGEAGDGGDGGDGG